MVIMTMIKIKITIVISQENEKMMMRKIYLRKLIIIIKRMMIYINN